MMIRITMLGVLIVLLGVFLGCSETPLQNTNELSGQNQQNVEFAALENDVVSLDLEDPQEPIEFTDEMNRTFRTDNRAYEKCSGPVR